MDLSSVDKEDNYDDIEDLILFLGWTRRSNEGNRWKWVENGMDMTVGTEYMEWKKEYLCRAVLKCMLVMLAKWSVRCRSEERT